MACPCKSRSKTKQYAYTDENGKTTTKNTEVEANAMKIRNDGKGEVKPVGV